MTHNKFVVVVDRIAYVTVLRDITQDSFDMVGLGGLPPLQMFDTSLGHTKDMVPLMC